MVTRIYTTDYLTFNPNRYIYRNNWMTQDNKADTPNNEAQPNQIIKTCHGQKGTLDTSHKIC